MSKKQAINEENIIANIEDLNPKIIQKHMCIMSIHQKFLQKASLKNIFIVEVVMKQLMTKMEPFL